MAVCGLDLYDQKTLLTFGGCLSVVCHCIVFYLFYAVSIPNLQRHPTTIFIRKCWFELIFVSQYLWLSFAPNDFFWNAYSQDDDGEFVCETNPNIWPLSWMTQFSLLGGELWFAVLSMDIHVSLTNPFSSYKMYDFYYSIFVFGMASLTATVLVGLVPIQYGLSTDPMIWVKDKENQKNNWTKIGMFYSYLSIIYIYCGIIAVWARWQIHRGLEETLKVRKYSVSKQTSYVIGYFLFWTVVFTLQFMVYLKEDYNADISYHAEKIFHTISAFVLASRGLWTLGIFLAANRVDLENFYKQKISENNPKEEEELVQLNVALQKEIVRFTALGIQKSVTEVLESEDRRRSASMSFFGSKLPGETVTFVVDDPEAFFSPRTISGRHQSSESSVSSSYNNEIKSKHFNNGFATRDDSTHSELELGLTPGSDNPLHDTVDRGSLPSPSPSLSGGKLHDHIKDSNATLSIEKSEQDQLESMATSMDMTVREESLDQIEITMDPSKPVTVVRKSFVKPNTQDPKQDEGQFRAKTTSTTSLFRSSKLGSMVIQQFERLRDRIASPRNSFVFTDFSPKRFARIRSLCNISIDDYVHSFTTTTMPRFSEGKSGAFLYFSSDYKYIVKTTTAIEFGKLLQILPSYESYLRKMHKKGCNSLLNRYLGAHRIIMYDIPLYFVVMKNALQGPVDEKYDLKGSWVNRHGSKMNKAPEFARPKKNYHMVRSSLMLHSSSLHHQPESIFGQQSPTSATAPPRTNSIVNMMYKATDVPSTNTSVDQGKPSTPIDNKTEGKKKESTPLFLDNDVQNSFIVHPEDAVMIAKQAQRDIKFLESFNLMDYSLLIGVHRKTYFLDSKPSQSQDNTPTNMRFNRTETLINQSTLSMHHIHPLTSNATPSFGNEPPITPVNINSHNNVQQGDHDTSIDTLMCPAAAVEGPGIFSFGIVDILQEWNWSKWFERMLKITFLRKDGNGLSAIEPHAYRKRFMQRAVIDIFASLDNMVSDSDSDFDETEDEYFDEEAVRAFKRRASKGRRSSANRNSKRQSKSGKGKVDDKA